MVKESKFFRKQAEKAERMARAVSDAEMSQRFLSMAKAYRSQANVLKAKEKPKAKKSRQKGNPRSNLQLRGLVDNCTNGSLP